MGGSSSSKKKKDPGTTDPNVFPDQIQPFTPMSNAPWADNPGTFNPVTSPTFLSQLGSAFSPEFLSAISSKIDLPPLPVTPSKFTGKDDDEDKK